MESPLYRVVLKDLIAWNEGKRLFTIKMCADYLGCSINTVKNRYGITQPIIAAELAQKLTERRQ